MFILIIFGEGLKLRSYSMYVICGLLIAYNLYASAVNRVKFFLNAELVLVFLFLIFSGLSYFWALNPALSLYRFKVLTFLTILVFMVTNQMFREDCVKQYLILYFLMGLTLSIACIGYFGLSGIKSMIQAGSRLGYKESVFMGINANTIGLDCAVSCILAWFFALFKKEKVYMLAMLPTSLIVVATGSRKGILMLLIGIIMVLYFYNLYSSDNSILSLLKILVVIFVLFIASFFALQLPGLEKLNEQYMGFINSLIGNKEEVDMSTEIRGRMVVIGWQQFLRTPILGVGLDNGKVINALYNNFSAYLHNNFIEVLVNGGIVGFTLYYSLFAVLLVKLIMRLRERNPYVFIALTLLVIRVISDWGRVSYFDYLNVMSYSFLIAVANKMDIEYYQGKLINEN